MLQKFSNYPATFWCKAIEDRLTYGCFTFIYVKICKYANMHMEGFAVTYYNYHFNIIANM